MSGHSHAQRLRGCATLYLLARASFSRVVLAAVCPQMVSDASTDSIVRWTDDGNAFVVLGEFAFAKQLLPLYFRHKNFPSFIRQLNFYNSKSDIRHTPTEHKRRLP